MSESAFKGDGFKEKGSTSGVIGDSLSGQSVPWSKVLTQPGSNSSDKLEYFPPQTSGDGVPIIRPPKDFLKSTQKAWSSSLVGYFLGSNLPYKLVEEEAKRQWLHLGFNKLYMVKKGFYVFKFNTELDKNIILAGGSLVFQAKSTISPTVV